MPLLPLLAGGESWRWQLRDRLGQWIEMGAEVKWLDKGRWRFGSVIGSPSPGKAEVQTVGRPRVVDTFRLTVVGKSAERMPEVQRTAKAKINAPEPSVDTTPTPAEWQVPVGPRWLVSGSTSDLAAVVEPEIAKVVEEFIAERHPRMTVTVRREHGVLKIEGRLPEDSPHQLSFSMSREVYAGSTVKDPATGTSWMAPSILNDFFKLAPTLQASGFATELNSRLERLYRERGVRTMSLEANVDVGGYAWARAGYDWDTNMVTDGEIITKVNNWFYRLDDHIGWDDEPHFTAEQSELAQQQMVYWRDQMDYGELPTPLELATIGRIEGANIRDDQGREIWPGKWMMLGTSWFGIKRLNPPLTVADIPSSESGSASEPEFQPDPDFIEYEIGDVVAVDLNGTTYSARIINYDNTIDTYTLELPDESTLAIPGKDMEDLGFSTEGEFSLARTLAQQRIRRQQQQARQPAAGDVWDSTTEAGDEVTAVMHTALTAAFPAPEYRVSVEHLTPATRLDGSAYITAKVYDRHNEIVCNVERVIETIETDDGDEKFVVHNEVFTVAREFQAKGVAADLNEALFNLYRQRGVARVSLYANIDVGGYAWARAGYDWDWDAIGPVAEFTNGIVSKLRIQMYALPPGQAFDVAQRDLADIEARLSQAIHSGDLRMVPSPLEMAMVGYQPDGQNPTMVVGPNTVVEIWPGKLAMLGTHWYGYKVP